MPDNTKILKPQHKRGRPRGTCKLKVPRISLPSPKNNQGQSLFSLYSTPNQHSTTILERSLQQTTLSLGQIRVERPAARVKPPVTHIKLYTKRVKSLIQRDK